MRQNLLQFSLLFVLFGLSTRLVRAEDKAFQLPEKIQFNRDVRTIFSKTCFACHGFDSHTREAELRLDVREDAIAAREEGRAIVPGKPDDSKAYQLMMSDDPELQMPPPKFHTQLTAREKAIIKKWIAQGAEYQTHWAFIPPVAAKPPKLTAHKARYPIDAFVRKKLEIEGMKAATPADRRTLIRRASLDLTGLPPTVADVQEFAHDPASDTAAYEKVVDRLLSSSAYGEQRARYWMDTSRYADTSGYQYDKIRHQWVWRDWVINAFNQNMPFDQFTVEQNAGDLIPNATAQSRLATGFHRNHPITIEGGVIDEEYRTEYVMDRVVTTTTTWMGLTFGCARCHDHKYDPIAMDDFYSLYAFFNNVPEKGLNGFAPNAKIASPLANGWTKKLKAAEQTFDLAMVKLEKYFPAWEAKLGKHAAETRAVKPDATGAQAGTVLTPQEDGSFLATGPKPGNQIYTIDFTLDQHPTEAIRLEALTHPSMVNGSTGLAHNGNYVLTEFEVYTAPAGAANDAFKRVDVTSASANYEQKGYPVALAIDKKLGGGAGWAIDGNSRFKNSEATFTLAQRIEKGSRVRLRLIHQFGSAHSIGRFRITVPEDGKARLQSSIRNIVEKAPAKRNIKENAELKRYLAIHYGPEGFAKLSKKLESLKSQQASAGAGTPATMILTELAKPRQTYVMNRGEYDKPIKERPVQPNVPIALGGLPEGFPANRLGLAKWLVSDENPLTARVTVNRFWAQLFGVGLVRTIEDFGSQGEYPSHPELLDWLAVNFMQSGWDTKKLFKAMVMSDTYRQSSTLTPEQFAHDPQNRNLARGPRFRLDAEAIRDSALAVGGLLDRTLGGPSVYPYHPKGLWMETNNRPGYSRAYPHSQDPMQLYRRSLYTYWKRTVAPPSMVTFDAPEREYCVVSRSRTNTPLQAFVMLHDPQFVEAARKLGERMMREGGTDPAKRIAFGFEQCTARPPSKMEMKLLLQAFGEHRIAFKADAEAAQKLLSVGQSTPDANLDPTELAAYAALARLLINLSEFITKG